MPTAHVGGLPVEELVVPAVTTGAAGLMFARGWLTSRLRRPREPGR